MGHRRHIIYVEADVESSRLLTCRIQSRKATRGGTPSQGRTRGVARLGLAMNKGGGEKARAAREGGRGGGRVAPARPKKGAPKVPTPAPSGALQILNVRVAVPGEPPPLPPRRAAPPRDFAAADADEARDPSSLKGWRGLGDGGGFDGLGVVPGAASRLAKMQRAAEASPELLHMPDEKQEAVSELLRNLRPLEPVREDAAEREADAARARARGRGAHRAGARRRAGGGLASRRGGNARRDGSESFAERFETRPRLRGRRARSARSARGARGDARRASREGGVSPRRAGARAARESRPARERRPPPDERGLRGSARAGSGGAVSGARWRVRLSRVTFGAGERRGFNTRAEARSVGERAPRRDRNPARGVRRVALRLRAARGDPGEFQDARRRRGPLGFAPSRAEPRGGRARRRGGGRARPGDANDGGRRDSDGGRRRGRGGGGPRGAGGDGGAGGPARRAAAARDARAARRVRVHARGVARGARAHGLDRTGRDVRAFADPTSEERRRARTRK